MIDEPMIGDWIVREFRGRPHFVESLVAGDVIARCGRRLTNEPTKTGGRLMLAIRVAGFSADNCKQCAGSAE